MTILKQVTEILADLLGYDVDFIKPEHKIVDDLNADSLDVVEIVMALEDEYGRDIPDEDVVKLFTVNDIVEYLKASGIPDGT